MIRFKNLTAVVFLIFCSIKLLSQDTLFLTSGFREIVIIKEISNKEIKYVKYKKPNGYVFYEYKKNIRLIKFANGLIDSLKPSIIKTKTHDLVDGVSLHNLEFKYQSKAISDKTFLKMIETACRDTTKNALLLNYGEMQKIKRKRVKNDLRFGATFLLMLESSMLLAMGFKRKLWWVNTIPLTFAALCGTSLYFSLKFGRLELNKKRKLVDGYNASCKP